MLAMAGAAALVCGCAVSQKKVVPPSNVPGFLPATKAELIARYNQQAQAITSLNATVTMKLTAGSAYSGVIEQYHETNAFILASRPSYIRVIGQAPVVGKNIFDMVSDGTTFHIFIPSKHKFIEGPAALERPAKKPVENLRPQHILDALFWPRLPDREQTLTGLPLQVLFEEAEEPTARYYVLTFMRLVRGTLLPSGVSVSFRREEFRIVRKVWFDRSDLNVARLEIFEGEGKLISDIHYSGWDTVNGTSQARQITLARPGDDYKLDIAVKKMSLNEDIPADKFVLPQPPGTELVRVGEDAAKEPKP
jgi:outer membrane lipoprotein-sorting protein